MRKFILTIFLLIFPSCAWAGAPGWHELANTSIAPLCPADQTGTANCPSSPYFDCNLNSACHSNGPLAYSGGAYDSVSNQLIIWGGGHGDYSGNEVYALSLGTTPAMSRLTNPGGVLPAQDTGADWMTDGSPISRHTYDALVAYNGNLFSFGGGVATDEGGICTPPNCGSWGWKFNIANKTWTQLSMANYPTQLHSDYTNAADYDQASGFIFVRSADQGSWGHYYYYNPNTDNWSSDLENGTNTASTMSGAIDQKRHRFYLWDAFANTWTYFDTSGSTNGGVAAYHRSSPLSTTGCSAFSSPLYPGVAYDPVADKMILYNGGTTICTYDQVANTWTETTPAGTAPPAPSSVLGRFRYVPSIDAFVVYTAVSADAWILNTRSSAITSFQLTSTSSGTLPFTVGVAFNDGDIPSGNYIVPSVSGTTLSSYQVTVKRTWNDGSVKHAIISGYYSSTANTSTTVSISTSTTAPSYSVSNVYGTSGSAVTVGTVSSTSAATPGGTVTLNTSTGTLLRTWITGPVMTEKHYRYAVSGYSSMQVIFYVRQYANGEQWARAVVENGTIDQATSDQSYVPTVTIGGNTIWNNGGSSYTHYANTRYSLTGWATSSSTSVSVTPAHDTAYLMNTTKLVPNYWQRNPSSTVLQSWLVGTYTPGSSGNWNTTMGNTGFQADIGILPNHEALYLTSEGSSSGSNPGYADKYAYASLIANTEAINSFAMTWNDSTTHLPIQIHSWGSTAINSGGGCPIDSPAAGSLEWDYNHQPSAGYLAYLVTGDYYYLETLEDQALLSYLCTSTAPYFGTGTGTGVNRQLSSAQRGVAWAGRTVGQAVAIAPNQPSTDPVITDLSSLLSNNINVWLNRANTYNNPTGIFYVYDQMGPGSCPYDAPDPSGAIAPWMHNFWAQAYSYISDIEPLPGNMTNLISLRGILDRVPVGLLGSNGSSNFCFTNASTYTIVLVPLGTDPLPSGCTMENDCDDLPCYYTSWGAIWTATYGSANTSCGNTLQGTSGSYPGIPEGYWGNLLPAIAYAAEHGSSGAAAAWGRLTGASNWSGFQSAADPGCGIGNCDFNDIPIWGIYPRQIASGGGSCSNQSISMSYSSTTPFNVGDADRAITCSATSGLSCSLSTNSSSICTIVSTAVHAVGVGTCIVYADQSGNCSGSTGYNAASEVSQSITITTSGGGNSLGLSGGRSAGR
jgi:hypothetical protein